MDNMKEVFFVFFAVVMFCCSACSSSSKEDTSDVCTENPSAPECQVDEEDDSQQVVE
jgi:hypothetical protein